MIFFPLKMDYSPPFSRINYKSYDKFSETILSASSITHQDSLYKDSSCFYMNYLILPGVAIIRSYPLDN